MIRTIPKLFKVVSGLQKTPSLCSSLYLQLFKFASSSDTGSIVSVMLRERRDSASLGRCFSGWSPQRQSWPLWQVSGCKESKGATLFPLSLAFPFPVSPTLQRFCIHQMELVNLSEDQNVRCY